MRFDGEGFAVGMIKLPLRAAAKNQSEWAIFGYLKRGECGTRVLLREQVRDDLATAGASAGGGVRHIAVHDAGPLPAWVKANPGAAASRVTRGSEAIVGP